MEPIVASCAGLDLHKKSIQACLLKERDGQIQKKLREFTPYRKDLHTLGQWLRKEGIELVVMESTGIYWKAIYSTLEEFDVRAMVVNARHIKQVPGRKTDVKDAEWLATLGLYGLVRASFIPPKDFRELRILTRYRRKLSGCLGSEKNRLHKVLEDAGIRLGSVVSDIDGVSARSMIEALIEGEKTLKEIAELAKGKLRKKEMDIALALEGELSDRHRNVLKRIQSHIRWLEVQIQDIDSQVVTAMTPYQEEWQLIQTIPGFDEISAAMLLAEIGPDMSRFGMSEKISNWAGVCPGNNMSAGKKSPENVGRAMYT